MNIFAEYLEILRRFKSTETRLSDIIDEHVEQVCGRDYEITTDIINEHEKSGRFTVYYNVYCNDMKGTVILAPTAFSFRILTKQVKSTLETLDYLGFSLAWLLRSLDELKTKYYSNKEDAKREIIVAIKRLLKPVCKPKITINQYSFDDIVIIDIKCKGYKFQIEAYRTTKMEIYGIAINE